MKTLFGLLVLAVAMATAPQVAQAQYVEASDFGGWTAIANGAVAASSGQVFTVRGSGTYASKSGVTFVPFSTSISLAIEAAGGTAETVTPSSVSCPMNALENACTVTATFSYVHNAGFKVRSGTGGLSEAQLFAPQGSVIHAVKTTTLATTSGTTVTATSFVPDGAVVQSMNVLVTTTITGPTSFKIGDGSDDDIWGATIGLTAGTKTSSADYTASGAVGLRTSATNVVLTRGSASDFTAGAVKLVLSYFVTPFAQ